MIRLNGSASAALVLIVAGCSAPLYRPVATAQLMPTKGSVATGQVQFFQKGEKLLVSGEISGRKPNAEHGFHVHEKGDCAGGDGMSTGGHFNPDAKPHGAH